MKLEKKTLMWNLKDPVDNEEYLKNIICYKHQKNINPFILNPDLMNFCFTDYYTLSNKMYSKKKESIIDPLYIIDYFINELNMVITDANTPRNQIVDFNGKLYQLVRTISVSQVNGNMEGLKAWRDYLNCEHVSE